MPKSEPKPIAIEDIAADLGIAESDVLEMLQSESAPIAKDYRGRPAVPAAYVGRLTAHDDYVPAVRRAIASEMRIRGNDKECNIELLQSRRHKLLLEYEEYIATLEALHRKYLSAANQAGAESSGMAVYLLLSRAIAILKMACFCLRNDHWYSGSMLREIDECLDLAKYFWIKRGTTEGDSALHKWYRENDTPSHARCREVISEWHASLVGDSNPDDHLDLMRELYHKKSKWIHPTFLAIREVAQYEVDGFLKLAAADYGPCTYARKLYELTEFFRSSIWSTFQALWLSFHHVFRLAPEDREVLHQHDLLFQSKANRAA